MSKVYLITGANRGLGFAIAENLAERPNVKIIATTRDISKSKDLKALADKSGSISMLILDVSDESSIESFGNDLEIVAPGGIDTFISNAGILDDYTPVLETPKESYLNIYKVNTIGAVEVLKVVYPHLCKLKTRQIVFMSSIAGSIGMVPTLKGTSSSYGASKAALNYTMKALSFELDKAKEEFTVISINPGLVDTDMGRGVKESIDADFEKQGIEQKIPLLTPKESTQAMLKVIDGLTKADDGRFINFDGNDLPY